LRYRSGISAPVRNPYLLFALAERNSKQAVIRVSKKYLPSMAVGYQHPNVKTHVGDGFKFLADRENEFDVIITDSSDPEGPAESLFQKPYFELLYRALKEGGVITTQGCSFSYFFALICCPSSPEIRVGRYASASNGSKTIRLPGKKQLLERMKASCSLTHTLELRRTTSNAETWR
jgi:hypothetical protein